MVEQSAAASSSSAFVAEEEEDEETLIQRALEMSMKDVNAPVVGVSSEPNATAMEVTSS